MLNQKNSKLKLLSDKLNHLAELFSFLWVHSGSRFIQKQKLRIRSKSAGNFQLSLLTVRQIFCQLVFFTAELKDCKKFIYLFIHNLFVTAEFRQAKQNINRIYNALIMKGNADVIGNRLTVKKTDILESSGNTHLIQLGR